MKKKRIYEQGIASVMDHVWEVFSGEKSSYFARLACLSSRAFLQSRQKESETPVIPSRRQQQRAAMTRSEQLEAALTPAREAEIRATKNYKCLTAINDLLREIDRMRAALALPPEGMGAQVIGEKIFVYDRHNPSYGWIAERGKDGLFTSLEYGKASELKATLNPALAETSK
jgi:hypothetical protein